MEAPVAAGSSGVWSSEHVHPAEIEAALRELEIQRALEERGLAQARVLNLVVVVDREWKGEIANRLERVGRYHPSRTIMCAVEHRKEDLDAWATLACDVPEGAGVARCRELVEIDMGEQHVARLATIVDPVLVSDVLTMVWAPHGHGAAVDALLGLADVVLLDSVDEADAATALARVAELAERAYVVDLAWLRSTPWRERIAANFDPPAGRAMLGSLASVTVRHRPDSEVSALLLLGWLASRLGWQPAAMVAGASGRRGRARARKGEVKLALEPDVTMPVPGLAGVTVETAQGETLSLDRGPGGLVAKRRDRQGAERSWRALGASRGEGGILGEGVRQALLRDPTYRPAVRGARALLG